MQTGQTDGPKAYDSAIRYGDAIVTQMIRMAQAAGFDTVVYFSDHGEVPHGGHRHSPWHYAPEMVEIPFLIWLSPEYRDSHSGLINRLQGARHRPYMTDDFFHTLIDLMGIQSSALDPSRSLINAHFKIRPRRVIDATVPYAKEQSTCSPPRPRPSSWCKSSGEAGSVRLSKHCC